MRAQRSLNVEIADGIDIKFFFVRCQGLTVQASAQQGRCYEAWTADQGRAPSSRNSRYCRFSAVLFIETIEKSQKTRGRYDAN